MSENPGSANIVLRNILVGLTTTVLGAIIVYFLGFKDRNVNKAPQEENMLAAREATIQAWKSYVAAENLLLQNFNTFSANFTLARFDEYKKLTLAEVDRFNTDIKKLLEHKKLDPSLVSLLERRLRLKESWLEKYKAHLNNYQRIANTTLPDYEKTNRCRMSPSAFRTMSKTSTRSLPTKSAASAKCLLKRIITISLLGRSAAFSAASCKHYRQLYHHCLKYWRCNWRCRIFYAGAILRAVDIG
ncbi:MAG: hypothetical protein IPM85_14770 [Chitinophagaceae bacterium]|nr:hypothetical protein [Chitinophagaceae bacterium]